MTLHRRTPLRRTPFRVRAFPSPDGVRARRKRTSKAEVAFQRDVLARDVFCQIGIFGSRGLRALGDHACSNGGVAVVAHHIGGRVGPYAHDPVNGIGLCEAHHSYVHANPEESYERGWMARRNSIDNPAMTGRPLGAA